MYKCQNICIKNQYIYIYIYNYVIYIHIYTDINICTNKLVTSSAETVIFE